MSSSPPATDAGLYRSPPLPLCQKTPILLFQRVLSSHAHTLPTSAAGCPKGNQKMLVIKLVGRVGFTTVWTRAWRWLPCKKESSLQGTQLCSSWKGTGAFEEGIKEALILALYLGELICHKYLLGPNADRCLCQVLERAWGTQGEPSGWGKPDRTGNSK